LTTALRNRVLKQLRQAADQKGRRAAIEGGTAVAITPSELLDGVFAGLRGIAVIRQVAQIYGLRPGPAVTVGLVRRVIGTVASVSGTELVSRVVADHFLDKIPGLKHLAGVVPGTSVAAIRLYRLAGITAKACSPVADE
jgi:putative membrane protein